MSDRLQHLDLTAAGEPYRPAHSGNAGDFDGVTDYINSTNFPNLTSAQPWTVMFSGETAGQLQCDISTIIYTGGGGFGQYTGIQVFAGGVQFFENGNSSNSANRTVFSAALPYTPSGKQQWIITYDGNISGPASSVQFFLNGERLAVTKPIANTTGVCDAGNNTVEIGRVLLPALPISYFHYTVDAKTVQMANRVLSSQEIRESFNAGTMVGTAANNEFLIAMDFDQTGTANPTNLVPITGSDTNALAWTWFGGPTYSSFF